MANVNAPFGLKPSRHLTGGEIRSNEYSIASGYTSSIFSGDVVELTGTDTNIQVAAAANVDNLGVFAGCSYVDSAGNQVFAKSWPASTTATNVVAYVYDDPDLIFLVQSDSTGVAAANVGALADWSVGTGNSSTGLSGLELDASAGFGTSGKSLRILRLYNNPENAYGANAVVEVQLMEHILTSSSGV